jgi:hypothetical protein
MILSDTCEFPMTRGDGVALSLVSFKEFQFEGENLPITEIR